jgi:Tol biopolymer transport system component
MFGNGRISVRAWAVTVLLFVASDLLSTSGVLPAADLLPKQRSFSAIGHAGALSRGGILLAYTVRAAVFAAEIKPLGHYTSTGMLPDYATGTELRVSNTRTGAVAQVYEGPAAVADPAWSPDGAQLAFYSDQGGAARLWLWNKATLQSRRVADAIARPSFSNGANLKWTLDSKYIIAPMLPKNGTLEQAATTSADLMLVDAVTGELKPWTREKSLVWYAPSPDGRSIGYAYPSGRTGEGGRLLFTIEVATMDIGTARVVAESTYANDGLCVWSPDGTRLAYYVSGARGMDGAHVVDVVKRTDRQATSITFSSPTAEDVHRRVYWAPDGASLYFVVDGKLWRAVPQSGESSLITTAEWNREVVQIVERGQSGVVWSRDDGRSITVTTRDAAQNMGFYRIEIATGKVTKLREDAKRYGDYMKPAISSDDGTFVIWATTDSQNSWDLWGAGPNLKDALRLTQLNP